MSKLPKKFPEYSIMYKTLTRKILELEEKKKSADSESINSIQKSIEEYKLEKEKIKKMFPENFFEDLENNEKF